MPQLKISDIFAHITRTQKLNEVEEEPHNVMWGVAMYVDRM